MGSNNIDWQTSFGSLVGGDGEAFGAPSAHADEVAPVWYSCVNRFPSLSPLQSKFYHFAKNNSSLCDDLFQVSSLLREPTTNINKYIDMDSPV